MVTKRLNKKGNDKFLTNKKAQVTIFIIFALIIVVIIAILFMVIRGPPAEAVDEENPQAFIESCTKAAVEEAVEKVLDGGGRINPELYKDYLGEKYNYLCYQKNYYLTCINSHPMLKSIMESEIKADSEPKIKNCFILLKQELEKSNDVVFEEGIDYNIELSPKQVLAKIDKDIEITKGERSTKVDSFKVSIVSPLYDLGMIAREVVNQEAQYCNFEYNGFMLLYPQYDIKRIDYDESKVYKITDRNSDKLFKFAIRSCAFPPGL